MKLIVALSAEAEHEGTGWDWDRRLWEDPALTERGREEANRLCRLMPLNEQDAVIAGPTARMLETATLWSGESACLRFVHPLAGPRQHPFRYDFVTEPCDRPMDPYKIAERFPAWRSPAGLAEYLWLQGIHTLPAFLFEQHVKRFVQWCKQLNKERVVMVTEAGTRKALLDVLRGEAGTAVFFSGTDEHGNVNWNL